MNSLTTISGHGFRGRVTNIQPAMLNSLTTTGYNSCQGAYGCRLLNKNYTGAVMTLRASGGTGASSAFYADNAGNLTTGSGGTGSSLASWLTAQGGNTTYAFVSTWHDQSVTTTNNATQATTGTQPIYDVANKVLNLGYTGGNGGVASPNGNCYFDLPNGALPYNDTSYTYALKHWNIGGGNYTAFFWGGNQTGTYCGCAISYYPNNYRLTWYGDDCDVSSTNNATTANVISIKYSSGGTRYIYVKNGSSNSKNLVSARVQPNTINYIGRNFSGYYTNAQIYYFYVFGSSLSDADRLIVEST